MEKVLEYEQDPGNGQTDYLNRAFYEDLTSPCCEIVAAHQDPAIDSTLWKQSGDPPSFPRDDQVVETLSLVHYGIVTVYSHGYTDVYWTMNSGGSERLLGIDDLRCAFERRLLLLLVLHTLPERCS